MEGTDKTTNPRLAIISTSTTLLLLLVYVSAIFATSDDQAELIWIGESAGVLAARQMDGSIKSEARLSHEARAIAVDAERDTLWVFSNKSVMGFSANGTQKFATTINPPNGQPSYFALDTVDGSIWLAVQSQIYLIDENGQVLNQQRMPRPISGITLDRGGSLLWAAYGGRIKVIAPDGSSVLDVNTYGAKTIHALDYDQKLNQVWVVADGSLRRYSMNAELVHQQDNEWFNDVTHIAADQSGKLWTADKRQLARIDQSGLVEFSLEPFADAQPDAILSLVADPNDGSSWVASQRRVAHYAGDSSQILEFAPRTEDGKTRLINQLALETPALAPRISIISPEAGAVLGTSRPEIALAIDGPEADLSSFEFRLNGAIRAFDCTQTTSGHICTASSNITDGQHLLTVTVANAAGNRSRPAEVSFTLDTVAPAIDIHSPEDGWLTNQTTVQITGRVSEPASFTINDISRAVQDDGSFSHGPFTLEEGENLFSLEATDSAGNTGSRQLHVTRDTIPPPPPDIGKIQAEQQSDGTVRVIGTAGSVEGGSTVTIVNTRTGERVTTVANPDGSFSASIAGENGDEIQVYATDRAGNVGATTNMVVSSDGPFSGPIKFQSISPGDGTTVDGDFVVITIDLQAPPNTGVAVNGVVALKVSRPLGWRYYAQVPLSTGENPIEIVIHAQDGRKVARNLNITSTGSYPYRITPDRSTGASPLETHIEVFDQSGRGIQQIQMDFDNNGTIDQTVADSHTLVATYNGVGLKRSRIVIFDNAGTPHSQVLTVLLLDLTAIDQDARVVWAAMLGALETGDKAAAMQYLSNGAKEQYEPIFDALMPKMPDIVSTYSEPQRSFVTRGYAEYGVNRMVSGANRIFLIGFVRNEFGQWQVNTM